MTGKRTRAGPRESRKPSPSSVQTNGRLDASWWPAIALAVIGLGLFANSLTNPFVFDDQPTIVENEQIRQLSAAALAPERELPVAGRPLVNLSFAFNYALGQLNPVGYHLGNIGLHVGCSLLIFGIVRRTFVAIADRSGSAGPEGSDGIAFVAALLWLVHPLSSEPVDYLTQRTESMMALFYLLTLYASIRRWTLTAVVACAYGMACKESMVTAPIAVVLYDRIFEFGSFREAFQQRWRAYAGLAATWLLLVGLLAAAPRSRSAGFSSDVSAWMYLLNQPAMIARYLRLSIWPTSLVANYGWPVALSLRDVLPDGALVAALLAGTLVALWRVPRIGFLLAWFFITLAPTSSIVPIATEVGAERRMYLPLAGLAVLAAAGAWRAWERRTVRIGVLIGGAVLLIVLATLTVRRNREYQSPVVLARADVERYPTPSARHVLAEQLLQHGGDRNEALSLLRQALPGAPRAHYSLGVELFKDGRLDEAIQELQAFIREQPRLVWVIEAHGYLGKAYAARERWRDAAREFEEILTLTPDNAPAAHSLADALNQVGIEQGSAGKLDEAIATFQRALQVDPTHEQARANLETAQKLKAGAAAR